MKNQNLLHLSSHSRSNFILELFEFLVGLSTVGGDLISLRHRIEYHSAVSQNL